MPIGSNSWSRQRPLPLLAWFGVFAIGLGLIGRTFGQTASTGALTGVTLDPSGAVLPGVVVHLAKEGGGEKKSATSDENGRFGFLLLPPGRYELQASTLDFEPVSLPEINIHVTETLRIELHLRLATVFQQASGVCEAATVQTRQFRFGKVVNETRSQWFAASHEEFCPNCKPLSGSFNRSVQRRRAWTWWNRSLADCQIERWDLRARSAFL